MITPQFVGYRAKFRGIIECHESLRLRSTYARFANSNSIAKSLSEKNEPVAIHAQQGFGQLALNLHSHEKSLSFVQIAEKQNLFPPSTEIANIAQEFAHTEQCRGRALQNGKEVLHLKGVRFIRQPIGAQSVKQSGCETTLFASDAVNAINTTILASKYIISPVSHASQNLDFPWKTSSSYVGDVIASSIQNKTQKASLFIVEIREKDSYNTTNEEPKSWHLN